MPVRVADAFVAIGADDRELDRALDRSRGKVGAWGNVVQGILQGVGQQLFRSLTSGLDRAFDALIGSGVRLNSSLENVQAQLVAFTKDGELAAQILADIRTEAAKTPFAFEEMAKATASLLPAAKQSGTALMELVEIAEILAASNPAQGLEGAAFSLREALSGDFVSIIERFNLSRKTLNALKEEGVPALEAITIAMNEMGLDASLVANLATTLTGRWSTFLDTMDTIRIRFSAPIFDVLKAGLTVVQNLLNESLPTAESFAEAVGTKIADGMVAGANAVARGVEIIASSIDVLGDIATFATTWGSNIIISFANGLLLAVPIVTQALDVLASLFSFWLAPGSPPRLLPDLTRWGTGAANAYLEGWQKADFTTLETVAGAIEQALRSFVGTGDLGRGALFGAITTARNAVADAVREFATMGTVSEAAFQRIRESSGNAGDAIERMARAYFNLRDATEAQSRAQEALQNVQDRYAEALRPLSDELRAVQDRRQEIRDQQRLAELRATATSPFATAQERELARLEAREIDLRQRQRDLERERDQELQNAQSQLDAASEAVEQAQTELNFSQAVFDQQIKTNTLLAEEVSLQQSLAEARRRAGEAASAAAEREREAAIRQIQKAIQDQLRETERIADAQFRYRLQVADTAGKLALYEEKLKKVQEGSAEYYAILTQIDQLEKQLAREREKAGTGGGIIPAPGTDIAEVQSEITERVQDIERKLSEAASRIQKAAEEAGKAWDDTKRGLDPVIERWGDLSRTLTRVSGVVTDDTVPILGKLFGFYFDYWSDRLGFLGGAWEFFTDIIEDTHRFISRQLIPIFVNAGKQMDPSFTGAVQKVVNALTGDGSLGEAFGQVFEIISKVIIPAIQDFAGTKVLGAAQFALDKFVSGWNALWAAIDNLLVKWGEVKTAFSISPPWANWSWPSFLQEQSPSPAEQSIRNLSAAVQQLGNISNRLQPFAGMAGGGTTVLHNYFNQQFAPGADVSLARQGARRGVDDSVQTLKRVRGR